MKLKISYDNDKDKFYFDYDDGTLETFYGLYAAYERLYELLHNEFTMAALNILDQVKNSDFGITIKIK